MFRADMVFAIHLGLSQCLCLCLQKRKYCLWIYKHGVRLLLKISSEVIHLRWSFHCLLLCYLLAFFLFHGVHHCPCEPLVSCEMCTLPRASFNANEVLNCILSTQREAFPLENINPAIAAHKLDWPAAGLVQEQWHHSSPTSSSARGTAAGT